jgi:hypothetical protein
LRHIRAYAFASFVIGTSFEFSPSSAARLRHLIVLGRDIADLSARLTDDELLGAEDIFDLPTEFVGHADFSESALFCQKKGSGRPPLRPDTRSRGKAIRRRRNLKDQ